MTLIPGRSVTIDAANILIWMAFGSKWNRPTA
jgi:hypothetical protein